MEFLDYVLLFVVVVVVLVLASLYNQINGINTNLSTQSGSLNSLQSTVDTNGTALTANTNAISAIQTTLASRSSTTSLTSMNSTLTPTFGSASASNVTSATCTSIYTALSTTMSECLNTISVIPAAASVTTLLQIPINIGGLTSISQVLIYSISGQSDSGTCNINNLCNPVIDITNKVIQVKFTANSTNAHIISLGLRLE